MTESRLALQITEVVAAFERNGIDFALIGGLALASHHVVRATQDVDLLVDREQSEEIESSLTELGYESLYRSDDAANYGRGGERLDLLYAHRPIARRLLAQARTLETPFGRLSVVSAEGLIGFKLQALENDPRRTQDLEDIRQLLKANRQTLDLEELREYFRLFGKESRLDELLQEID